MKKWIEIFADTVFDTLSKHKGWLLTPSLVLLIWFPISFVIDAFLVHQHGLLAVWWCVVDAYTTYFLAVMLCAFIKKWQLLKGETQ